MCQFHCHPLRCIDSACRAGQGAPKLQRQPLWGRGLAGGRWCISVLLLLWWLPGLSRLGAAPVEPAWLAWVAANWLTEHVGVPVSTAELVRLEMPGCEGLAVFKRAGGGWVLVADNDLALPVLGYSPVGVWGEAPLPSNCRDWLEWLSATVAAAKPRREDNPLVAARWAKYLVPPAEFQAAWWSASRGFGQAPTPPVVGPLLTTAWGQTRHYNRLCPPDPAGEGGRCLTGCVATVMGQIMRFHQHPASGFGAHGYEHPVYGHLAADFGAAIYDWAAMPGAGRLTSDNLAVSELMFHCGVAVSMDYGPDVSSATMVAAIRALRSHFRYHPGLRLHRQADFAAAAWDALLQAEIDAGRPVIYDGPGHAFIADGYDANAPPLYHFNWGWDGLHDGFYALSALTPGDDDFSSSQRATIGIQPEGDIYASPTYFESFEGAGLPDNWFADGDLVAVSAEMATAGSQSLRLGAASAAGYVESNAYTKLAVPAGGGALSFDYYRSGTAAGPFDLYRCEIRAAYGDTVLETVFSGPAADSGWQRAVVDLSAYAGQFVCLYFELVDATAGNWAWMLIDNLLFVDTPITDFSTPRRTWFANRPLVLENRSANATDYAWTFAGGVPAASTAVSPTVVYATAGIYAVWLTASNSNGEDTKGVVDYLVILPEPTIPYHNDFEANGGGFLAYPIRGDHAFRWEWGACASANFSGLLASIGGTAGWATMLATHHGWERKYALESPPFAFLNGLGNYSLSFAWRALTGTAAGFNVEVSTDGGGTWKVLGQVGDPLAANWYTEAAIAGLDGQPGWTSDSVAVHHSAYEVTAYAGLADVRFRLVMGARESAWDGVQVDDFGVLFAPIFEPAVEVRGKGLPIVNGASTVDLADGTDFGLCDSTGERVTRSFSIANLGNTNLVLVGTPPVGLSGPGAGAFKVAADPPTTLAAGAVDSFAIAFDPAAGGLHLATVAIATNDPRANLFTFAIAGTGVVTQALTVHGGSGSGRQVAGTVVPVVADPPLAGRRFSRWVGGTEHLAEASAASTTLVMPEAAVELTAAYTFEMPLAAGWNAIALPFQPLHGSLAIALAAGSRSGPIAFDAWSWDGAQFRRTFDLAPFLGVWIRVAESATLVYEGSEMVAPAVELVRGWQLLGPATPVGLGQGSEVGWTAWSLADGAGYRRVGRLRPGHADWLWVVQAGELGLAE